MRSRPLLVACVLLFTLSQVSGKPFFWGDRSYYTTKVPLLKRAFSKINHWFKGLIDAYPSSTWHWKEHLYGRTFWKDPKVVRAWMSIKDPGPLAMKYQERNTPKQNNIDPLGWPGQTRPKWNPDYIDDNILSIPNSEELAAIEAKKGTKKMRKHGDRAVMRGISSSSYETYRDPNNREQEKREDEERAREEEAKLTTTTLAKDGRNIQRGAASESYEMYENLHHFSTKNA